MKKPWRVLDHLFTILSRFSLSTWGMCSIVKLLIIAWARFGYEMVDSQWGMKFQVDYNPVISNKHRYGIALEVIVVQALPPQQGGIPRVCDFWSVLICRSPERVRNPHLRAKLAQTLEALVPIQKSQNSDGLLSVSPVNMVIIAFIIIDNGCLHFSIGMSITYWFSNCSLLFLYCFQNWWNVFSYM